MKKISNEKLLDAMQLKFELLAKDALNSIRNKEEAAKNFYNLSTHSFLQSGKENSAGYPREVILPLPKKDWPERFLDLEKNYDSYMIWPWYSMYCYTMDVACPPNIPFPLLHFGYAVYGDKLVQCPFFVVFQMTEQSLGDTREMLPEGFAIDPLASMNGVTPDCYVGISVTQDDIFNWFSTRGKTGHPLENYIQRLIDKKEEKRKYNMYMEAYILQSTYEPGWFPQELINFAKKEGLSIPKQERTDTFLGEDSEQKVDKIVD